MAQTVNPKQLDRFMHHLLEIRQQSFGIYTRGLYSTGMASSRTLTGNQMQKAAMRFAEYCEQPVIEPQLLARYAKEVEASIFSGLTIGAMDDKQADSLLDELYTVIGK